MSNGSCFCRCVLQFSTENINELMSYTDVGGGEYNMEDAACEFLKNSESVDWRSWLQIEDRCIGAGDTEDQSRRFTWDEELQQCTEAMECQPGTCVAPPLPSDNI